MRKIVACVSLLLAACTSQPTDPITPEFDGQHALPHAGPCHDGETETQGQGGVISCTAS